jgi:hypothetical protein
MNSYNRLLASKFASNSLLDPNIREFIFQSLVRHKYANMNKAAGFWDINASPLVKTFWHPIAKANKRYHLRHELQKAYETNQDLGLHKNLRAYLGDPSKYTGADAAELKEIIKQYGGTSNVQQAIRDFEKKNVISFARNKRLQEEAAANTKKLESDTIKNQLLDTGVNLTQQFAEANKPAWYKNPWIVAPAVGAGGYLGAKYLMNNNNQSY